MVLRYDTKSTSDERKNKLDFITVKTESFLPWCDSILLTALCKYSHSPLPTVSPTYRCAPGALEPPFSCQLKTNKETECAVRQQNAFTTSENDEQVHRHRAEEPGGGADGGASLEDSL